MRSKKPNPVDLEHIFQQALREQRDAILQQIQRERRENDLPRWLLFAMTSWHFFCFTVLVLLAAVYSYADWISRSSPDGAPSYVRKYLSVFSSLDTRPETVVIVLGAWLLVWTGPLAALKLAKAFMSKHTRKGAAPAAGGRANKSGQAQ